MLKLPMTRLLASLSSQLPSLTQCSSAAQPKLVFQITSNLPSSSSTPPLILQTTSLHTTTPDRSRVKQVSRHKAFWHVKKLNKAEDEPVTGENKEFLQALLTEQYQGPLKKELAPYSPGEWTMWSRRCGVLATKIGVQPLWLKDGRRIITTLLHVSDCHVVRVTPRDKYQDSYLGEKDMRPCYTGKGRAKGADMVAMVVVGSGSTDPQKFTKDYCGLFTDSGVMPKRHLGRFPVTSNAVLQPGTPLTASHFTVGQWVDTFGRTQERGFHGGMKRWGFHGMPDMHGVTKSHRRIGCIGSGRAKSRVWPGQKMPGQVGGKYKWACGLRVWRINHDESVLYVSGTSVPGKTGDTVQVCDTRIPGHRWEGLAQDGRREKYGSLVEGPARFPTAKQGEVEGEEWSPLVHCYSDPSIAYA